VLRTVLIPASIVHALGPQYVDSLGLGAHRTVVIPNDVEVPECISPPSSRRRIVAFFGQISRRKGVDTLLRSWGPYSTDGWQLVLYGEMTGESDELLSDLPAGVEYGGLINPKQVSEVMREASIVVLPSRAEAMPMALCEAMAHGCAIAATHVGAVSMLLGESAFDQLCAPDDVPGFSVLLARLVQDERQRAELARLNRNRAEKLFRVEVPRLWSEIYSGADDNGRGSDQ